MENNSIIDRAMGAVMGTLVGDALGLGCHWYYDLDQLKADFGGWVSGYNDSKTDRKDRFAGIARFRHEAGLRAGDVSQTGQVTVLLMESVAGQGAYDEKDFTSKLDALLETLDGTPFSGRYTDWAMRDVWQRRRSGMEWPQAGSAADTSEAAVRSVILAARYFKDPESLAKLGYGNIRLTHHDPYIAGQSLSFALTLSALISGTTLSRIGEQMSRMAGIEAVRERIPSFDCLTQAANASVAVRSPVTIAPASLISSIYGMACTLGFMLPAAYYLIHRYPEDFETAVLCAVNGGGNNMARAALTGALSGAMVGLSGIPDRFISGLKDHERLLPLAENVAKKGSA